MNILLTNDDGFTAPGLCAAYDAVAPLGRVHVVAPATERSACSHALSLNHPLVVERFTHERFGPMHAVDGTPADCVRLAIGELLDAPIGLVVSGINRGANTGVDLFYSGTIAGAREAAMLGLPAVAVSHAVRVGVEIGWAAASAITTALVNELCAERLPRPGFWSINYPACLPSDPLRHVRRVPVALEPVPPSFNREGDDDGAIQRFTYGQAYWTRQVSEPTDYSIIRDGGIAVSAVPVIGRF